MSERGWSVCVASVNSVPRARPSSVRARRSECVCCRSVGSVVRRFERSFDSSCIRRVGRFRSIHYVCSACVFARRSVRPSVGGGVRACVARVAARAARRRVLVARLITPTDGHTCGLSSDLRTDGPTQCVMDQNIDLSVISPSVGAGAERTRRTKNNVSHFRLTIR